jgi:hypothetical protein
MRTECAACARCSECWRRSSRGRGAASPSRLRYWLHPVQAPMYGPGFIASERRTVVEGCDAVLPRRGPPFQGTRSVPPMAWHTRRRRRREGHAGIARDGRAHGRTQDRRERDGGHNGSCARSDGPRREDNAARQDTGGGIDRSVRGVAFVGTRTSHTMPPAGCATGSTCPKRPDTGSGVLASEGRPRPSGVRVSLVAPWPL